MVYSCGLSVFTMKLKVILLYVLEDQADNCCHVLEKCRYFAVIQTDGLLRYKLLLTKDAGTSLLIFIPENSWVSCWGLMTARVQETSKKVFGEECIEKDMSDIGHVFVF